MISEPVAVFDDVVEHRDDTARRCATILLAAQSAPDHLHVPDRAEDRTRDYDHIGLWGIEAGGKDAIVAEYFELAALKLAYEVLPRRGFRAGMHRSSLNPSELEQSGAAGRDRRGRPRLI